ncbi:hypothetical protein H2204_006809 [Knufia peltigerae]|nr:hypothetical protein H2204_006809 [Knufia peltigerae]
MEQDTNGLEVAQARGSDQHQPKQHLSQHESLLELPPAPEPGTPYISQTILCRVPATKDYVLNHVALQIESPASSLAFYIDFLGMSLIFVVNTGPFTAYYLGYPQKSDVSPADMAAETGVRSGLLELISLHDKVDDTPETSPSKRRGFAHLGIRVPDVSETLKLAKEKGWKVIKHLDNVEPYDMPLPGKIHGAWQAGFDQTFAQIGFLEDPDG